MARPPIPAPGLVPFAETLNAVLEDAQESLDALTSGKQDLGVAAAPQASRRLWRTQSMLTTFPSGHGFTKNNGTATAADDTSVYALGSQSYRIETSDTNSSAFRKTGLGPFDISNSDIVVWVRVDDISQVDYLQVYLSSDSFTNFAAVTFAAAAIRPLLLSNEWIPVTISRTSLNTTGSPDFGAITGLQVRVKAISSTPLTVWFGGIGLIPRPAAPVVSITFDDGYANVYDRGIPIMSAYGQAATSYLICDQVGVGSNVSLTQCERLRDIYGWEMAFHSATTASHAATFPALTEDEIAADFAAGRAWLAERGFSGGDHMAYPGGAFDEKTLRQVRRFFGSARTIYEGIETMGPADAARLRVYQCYNNRSPATINAAIDLSIAGNGWTILVFHQIVAPGQASQSTQYAEDDFAAVMEHIAATGVVVQPVGQVMRGSW